MQRELFGTLPDGKQVFKYVLKNKNGLEVHVINYGAIITQLWKKLLVKIKRGADGASFKYYWLSNRSFIELQTDK